MIYSTAANNSLSNIWSMKCQKLVVKKWQSQLPKTQGDIFKCILSDQSPENKCKFTFIYDKEKQILQFEKQELEKYFLLDK